MRINLDCGHQVDVHISGRNLFYSYTVGENLRDLSAACPQGCGLRSRVMFPEMETS